MKMIITTLLLVSTFAHASQAPQPSADPTPAAAPAPIDILSMSVNTYLNHSESEIAKLADTTNAYNAKKRAIEAQFEDDKKSAENYGGRFYSRQASVEATRAEMVTTAQAKRDAALTALDEEYKEYISKIKEFEATTHQKLTEHLAVATDAKQCTIL
jgi:hypothetical protein